MLNTECKQCHKKWRHENAKYCSMCGKKLVSDPEFKSGDIVASQVFSDDSFSLVRLNKDLTNRLTPVDGLWYTKRDCDITDMSLGVFKKDTRHATPEEIAEYKAALNFHKHGRKPFEVKKGDLIRTPSEKFTLILYPENYTKEEFLDFYRSYQEKERSVAKGKEGGDFYATQNLRIGRRFAEAVVRAARESKLLYRDAYQLTGLYGDTFEKYAQKIVGGAMGGAP